MAKQTNPSMIKRVYTAWKESDRPMTKHEANNLVMGVCLFMTLGGAFMGGAQCGRQQAISNQANRLELTCQELEQRDISVRVPDGTVYQIKCNEPGIPLPYNHGGK